MNAMFHRCWGGAFAALSVVLAASPVAVAQSDLCAAAMSISAGSYSGSTAGATSDGIVTCAGAAVTPDMWYRFTPTENCQLHLDTCGSGYDTALSVHSGCPGTPENQLACNDDSCGLHSVLVLAVQAGQDYFIRVAGWNGATGAYVLNVSCTEPAPQDTCATALEVGPGTYTGTTAGASSDGSSACGLSANAPDHWYRVVPPTACILHVQTCVDSGPTYDTVLSLHSGCPGTTANEIACNDDSCAFYQSVVQAFVAGGQPVYIRVSGYNGARGPYTLSIEYRDLDIADSCAQALEITDGAVFGSTQLALPDGSSSCGPAGARDVWYRYESPANCTLILETCGSPTLISVHSACPGTAANQLACAIDSCGGPVAGARVSLPVSTGQTLHIRIAGADAAGEGGAFTLQVRCASTGADITIAELSQMAQFGRLGDVIGAAVHTPVCNAGTEPLDWYNSPDPRHPFQTFNLYRLRDGRLEQIGASWVKHGYAAAQGNACGLGCIPHPNATRLGVGCSDTYGASLNANQMLLGPRHEVHGWTGAYNYATSVLSNPNPILTPISRRLQLRDADLDQALNPGASYIAEVFVFGHDDVNRMNSVVHEPVAITGAPGGTWDFNLGAAATRTGPAILAWPGATRSTALMPDGSDGRCIVASRVTDNGDGTWRYEYAVYNHDLDRGVRVLTIPLRPGIVVSNPGFSAVRSHDEPFTNAAWTMARTGGGITWSTPPPTSPSGANPLRWGTMYNFWFDADAPPVDSTATLRLFRTGVINQLRTGTQAPAAACAADIDLDGVVTSVDISGFVSGWLTSLSSGTLDGDFDGDGTVSSADIAAFITAWLAAVMGGC